MKYKAKTNTYQDPVTAEERQGILNVASVASEYDRSSMKFLVGRSCEINACEN